MFSVIAVNTAACFKMMILVVLLTMATRAQDEVCKDLRFANFADVGQIQVLVYTENMQIEASKVSSYRRICLKLSDDFGLETKIKIENKNVNLQILDTEFDRYLVIVYWDNSFSLTAYPDIKDEDIKFKRTHPYAPNVFWRFLIVPTGALSSSKVLISSSSCMQCGLDVYEPNMSTEYTATNSLGFKTIVINQTEDIDHNRQITVADNVVFNSRGVYSLIYMYNTQRFVMIEDRPSEAYFLPLSLLVFCFVVLVATRIVYRIHRKSQGRRHYRTEKSIKLKRAGNRVPIQRLGFVDVLRGLALTGLLFCTQGGGNYNFFKESLWVGYTYADIPEFILAWVMGFCIPFSHSHREEESLSRLQQIIWILIKGSIMIVTGFICNKNTQSTTAVFLGFFQYMGSAYILINLLYQAFPASKKTEERYFKQKSTLIKFSIMTTMVIIHTLIVLLVNAPGCPKGYQGPGGKVDRGANWNCTGGLYGYIDTYLFTANHLRLTPACSYMFSCQPFSNYSILGFVTFLYGVYLGMMTGQMFYQNKHYERRIKFLILEAIFSLCVGAGVGMTSDHLHTSLIPPNKSLWSLSYITLSNFVTCLLAIFLYSAEDRFLNFGWPFKAVGRNTPVIYILASLLSDRFPFSSKNSGTHLHTMTSNLVSTSIWISVAVMLHKYRFYVKY